MPGVHVEVFKVFCDLAETKSFSKAAALNAVTQSAVSQQIRSLEERFKVALVERGHRNFRLTPEGAIFLQASREMLAIYTQLGARMKILDHTVVGELRLASIYSIGLHELPPRLKIFRARHPEVEVHVEYRRSPQVYAQVLNGDVDLGLVAYPTRRPGLHIDIFDEDEMVLICHGNHPLAAEPVVKLQRLNGEKFIAFEPDAPTRKVIDKYLREHQVEIVQTMEFDNVETVKRAVEIESGVSIVPLNTVRQEVANGALVAVPLEAPKLFRPLGVISRRDGQHSPAHREFVAALRDQA